MSLSDPEILELNALCSALVDRTLDAAGQQRLNALLAQSDDARRFYVRSMALSASLHDYAGEMQADEPEPQSRIVRVAAWKWIAGSLAAAAAVVLALWIGGAPGREAAKNLASATEEESAVATLSATNGCQWIGAAPEPGDEFRRGQQLQLASGIAEITFDSGAQVVLEGPASLDLNSAWEAVLRRGTLRANVPPEAVGFRVSNADVEVTDLGTEFSMVAGDQGGTEVFVLRGAIEATGHGGTSPITLHEKQARRFDLASVTEVRDREQKLRRWAAKSKLVHFAGPAGYIHWSFDEESGSVARAETSGLVAQNAQSFDAQIVASNGAMPQRVEGYRQRALAFDGQTQATASVPFIARAAKTTVAFWVRIPADATLPEAGTMVALRRGSTGPSTRIWWNREPEQGALGALRTETEAGPLIGTTPLRDGRWHHIAVAFGMNGRARQYVDGRLEGSIGKHAKKLRVAGERRDARHATGTLMIGGTDGEGDEVSRFHGWIDELFLADRALTPPEIQQLQRENKPAPPQTIADAGAGAF